MFKGRVDRNLQTLELKFNVQTGTFSTSYDQFFRLRRHGKKRAEILPISLFRRGLRHPRTLAHPCVLSSNVSYGNTLNPFRSRTTVSLISCRRSMRSTRDGIRCQTNRRVSDPSRESTEKPTLEKPSGVGRVDMDRRDVHFVSRTRSEFVSLDRRRH